MYKRKILYDERGIEYSSTALKSKIRDIEDKMELSSILIAREHAHAEVKYNIYRLDFSNKGLVSKQERKRPCRQLEKKNWVHIDYWLSR